MARLLNTSRKTSKLVMIGELINWRGNIWVVTGHDSRQNVVWIAKNAQILSLRPSENGMAWERLNEGAMQ